MRGNLPVTSLRDMWLGIYLGTYTWFLLRLTLARSSGFSFAQGSPGAVTRNFSVCHQKSPHKNVKIFDLGKPLLQELLESLALRVSLPVGGAGGIDNPHVLVRDFSLLGGDDLSQREALARGKAGQKWTFLLVAIRLVLLVRDRSLEVLENNFFCHAFLLSTGSLA